MKRDISRSIDREALRLIQSGGINISNIPNGNYAPAKIILSISLQNIAHGYKPFSSENLEEYRNLKHF
jgi:hypothetical protein